MTKITHQSPLFDGQIPALFYDTTDIALETCSSTNSHWTPGEDLSTDEMLHRFLPLVDTLLTWLQFSVLKGNSCGLKQELVTLARFLLLKMEETAVW